ncbi:MAG: Spy/CpxP family protein refolding chaperone [Sulfurovaceae bacterium]|nr:Spy/CpxP family protein refolding chaperone [Sulfurovaceae bacterium]
MNKKGFLIAALTVAATLASAAPMKCNMGGGSGGMVGACGCEGPMPAIMSLDLTSDQRTKMQNIMKQWHMDRMEMMQGNGKPMLSAFHDGKFDRQTFIVKHTQMTTNMANKKADVIEKMYSLLTPEQKKALETNSK